MDRLMTVGGIIVCTTSVHATIWDQTEHLDGAGDQLEIEEHLWWEVGFITWITNKIPNPFA